MDSESIVSVRARNIKDLERTFNVSESSHPFYLDDQGKVVERPHNPYKWTVVEVLSTQRPEPAPPKGKASRKGSGADDGQRS